MNTTEGKANAEDDFSKGIAYFWRSTNLEPRIRSLALRDGIAKVALGNHHTLLLTFNSQLLSVGDNSFGQLGLGDLKPRREPTVVDYLRDKRVLEISCGGHHSGVICGNNEVFFWGDSSSGQCGVGEGKLVNQPCQVHFEHSNKPRSKQEAPGSDEEKVSKKRPVIQEIACGESHSLALTTAGEVWSWGTGCQIGHGVETEQVNVPKKIEFLTGKNVTSIDCGAYHSLAIVQENKPCPTFMACRNENVTSRSEQKPKREKGKKKQRRSFKESSRKSLTAAKHHEGSTSSRKAKVDKSDVISHSNIDKPIVTRTYLSYEPVLSTELTGDPCETVKDQEMYPELGENEDKVVIKDDQKFDSLDYVDVSEVPSQSTLVKRTQNEDPSLVFWDSHFANAGETTTDQYFNITIEQANSSGLSAEANENILYSSRSPLFPSSPSSLGSLYFTSTDSDSEDSYTKSGLERKAEETSLAGKISAGFYSGFGSRLIKSDVNLSKLTSTVVGSVAGIFSASVSGQLNLHDPSAALMAKKPCKHCGLSGLCLCDSGACKFRLAGANTQVWSWGRGGCGQLGLGDTEDRYEDIINYCMQTFLCVDNSGVFQTQNQSPGISDNHYFGVWKPAVSGFLFTSTLIHVP